MLVIRWFLTRSFPVADLVREIHKRLHGLHQENEPGCHEYRRRKIALPRAAATRRRSDMCSLKGTHFLFAVSSCSFSAPVHKRCCRGRLNITEWLKRGNASQLLVLHDLVDSQAWRHSRRSLWDHESFRRASSSSRSRGCSPRCPRLPGSPTRIWLRVFSINGLIASQYDSVLG